MSKYCIKELPIEEFYKAFSIGLEFQEEVEGLRDKPDLEVTKAFFNNLYDYNLGTMLVIQDTGTLEYLGLLGAIIAPDVFSGILTASEVVWYVRKDKRGCGLLLIKAFEKWAIDNNAKYITMCHMIDSMPEKVGALYERMGYTKQDIIYRKEIHNASE